MLIPLARYTPFSYTKEVAAHFKRSREASPSSLLDRAQKIGQIALVLLSLLPALLLDLLICPISLLSRCRQISPLQPVLPPAPPLRPTPRHFVPSPLTAPLDDKTLLQNALETALSLIPPERKKDYREMMRDEGVADNPPVDNIYHWAACSLLGRVFLETADHPVHHHYPEKHPQLARHLDTRTSPLSETQKQTEFEQHEQEVAALCQKFQTFKGAEQDAIYTYLVTFPHCQLQLATPIKEFVQKVQARALLMTQDPEFYHSICSPIFNSH